MSMSGSHRFDEQQQKQEMLFLEDQRDSDTGNVSFPGSLPGFSDTVCTVIDKALSINISNGNIQSTESWFLTVIGVRQDVFTVQECECRVKGGIAPAALGESAWG